jgi:predicted Zn-dependent protease with MMP-like domain
MWFFIVQDYPSEDDLKRTGAGKFELLGLYSGVPLSKRGTSYGMYPVTPDRILIFKANIERICKTEKRTPRENTRGCPSRNRALPRHG